MGQGARHPAVAHSLRELTLRARRPILSRPLTFPTSKRLDVFHYLPNHVSSDTLFDSNLDSLVKSLKEGLNPDVYGWVTLSQEHVLRRPSMALTRPRRNQPGSCFIKQPLFGDAPLEAPPTKRIIIRSPADAFEPDTIVHSRLSRPRANTR